MTDIPNSLQKLLLLLLLVVAVIVLLLLLLFSFTIEQRYLMFLQILLVLNKL